MNLKDKVMPAGTKFLEFRADQEPWTQYTLENGAVLRARLVLVKVVDEGKINPDGSPQYMTQFQQVMDMTWPEDVAREIEARRKGMPQ